MRRADIFAGSAFKSAVLAVAIMAVAFVIAGTFAYRMVGSAMRSELERQLVAEVLLFDEVYQTGGQGALVEAVQKLEHPVLQGDRYVTIVDSGGTRLAGNLDITPDFLSLTHTIGLVRTGDGRTLAVSAKRYDRVELVVGRDTRLIDVTLRTLIYVLLAAFVLILVAATAAGWVLSKRSLEKLTHISDVLERVGRGDTTARIGAVSGDGQIDRMAGMIDQSLGRLSTLSESSQNTLRAIAHDLRTPLNRTLIHLEEAAMAASEDRREELLADAREELHGLGSVFDTVLRISALETSLDRKAFGPVDLAAVVAETVPLFEADFTLRDQRVETEATPPVMVRGDGQALRQLLVNLLANANRHAGPGTLVRVRAKAMEGDGAMLEVCDTGPGIAPEARELVLKPFARLDQSRTIAGTGLGLALVNAIVIRHGAELDLGDNTPGLCVRIRFPADAAKITNL